MTSSSNGEASSSASSASSAASLSASAGASVSASADAPSAAASAVGSSVVSASSSTAASTASVSASSSSSTASLSSLMRGVGPSYRVVRDADQFVQLGGALAADRPGLDVTGVGRHGEVCDGGVLGLARTVGDDRLVPVAGGELDRVERVRQRPDLVRLDEDAVGRAGVDAVLKALDVGDEQVVAADQRPVADPVGQLRERLVVVLVERVLDVREVVLVDQTGDVLDLFVGRFGLVAVHVRVRVVVVQFGGGHVEPEADLESDLVLDTVDRLLDDLERLGVGDRGCPRALVALRRGDVALVEHVRDRRVDGGV